MKLMEKALFIRLPELEHKRLKIAAVEDGRPMAQLVRDAVRQYLEARDRRNG